MTANEEFTGRDQLSRRRHLLVAAAVVAASIVLPIAGCHESDRFAVSGAVTLDGEPIDQGQIVFFPLPGTGGPSSGAPIVGGRYQIAPERGPMPGKFRVEITAMAPTSRQKQAFNVATGQTEPTEEFESLVPPRYNRESELTVKLTAAGPDTFDFHLKSH